MIPLRVKLKGFLCYKDEQEVCFDGSSLWMLSGLNGSGKSAVFDAVTYALFGHHRGGSQKVDELINKNSDGLEVEFEFLQDNDAYRIRRTAKRKAGGGTTSGQQIFRRTAPNGTPEGKWEAVPDTSKKGDFDGWIERNIGLNYDTFTSSVLLLQGKAEKLLDSAAKGRFEVLAGIVDLERYQRLHQRADDRRRAQDAELKSLRDRLAAIPEVAPLELLESEASVQQAEQARQQAQQEVTRLQGLEFEARQWQDVSARLSQTQGKVRQTEAMLARGADIERDEARLRELQLVLPLLTNAAAYKRDIDSAATDLAALGQQREKVERELARAEEEIQKGRHKRATLEATLAREERRQREVSAESRELAAQLEKLKEYERQEQDLARLREEAARLPRDPAADLARAREAAEQLTALAQVVPQLARLAERRQELRATLELEKAAAQARQQIEAQGKRLKAEVDQLKAQLAGATQARQQADEQATRTRTLLEQAKVSLEDLSHVKGAKVCRHCGQELTPAHIQDETVRRQREAAEADGRHQQAQKEQIATRQRERQLRELFDARNHETQQAREDYVTQKTQAEQARKDVERLQGECLQAYTGLPEAFRHKVSREVPADWLKTMYPAAEDLDALRQQVAGQDPARQRLREAEAALTRWNEHKARESTVLQTLHRMQGELPKDRANLRERHASLSSEEQALEKTVAATRAALADNQKEAERLARQREQVQAALAKCRADVQTRTATQETARANLARTVKELPEAWKEPARDAGFAALQGWERERADLVAAGTEQKGRELQQARLALEGLRGECADLEARLARFPEEARQGPAAVQQLTAAAREHYKQADETLRAGRQRHTLLENHFQQRQRLQQGYLETDRRLAHGKLLAELLGRERLQLHLVRQAERQVVDHANAVLDRLSGGELYLRLVGEAGGEGNNAKALELEAHNRVTGEKPINVAFLSGSQKFRVAVSLALGIGQYASRQHRPIESVIIDEGFGCLDRNARQVMIQELQNLRSQMRCILLVSHQEEFADAFADGYHFELHNGSTVARRFQR